MQQAINRNNYEIYFLDAIEGNLAPIMEPVLHEFLLANPDLAIELEQMRDAFQGSLPEMKSDEFAFKSGLHKAYLPCSEDELNQLLIDEIEQNLEPLRKDLLEKWVLIYPEVAKARKLFSATILREHSLEFSAKNSILFDESLDFTDNKLLLAAAAENDLDAQSLKSFGIDPINDKDQREAISILRRLRLRAGHDVFDRKETLYRRETAVIPFRRITLSFSAAAAVLVLLFTIIRYTDSHKASVGGFAETNPQIKLTPANNQDPESSSITESNVISDFNNSRPYNQQNKTSPVRQSNQNSFASNNDSKNSDRIPVNLVNISPLPGGEVAMSGDPGIISPPPDMRLVYQNPLPGSFIPGENRTINLFDYLSKSATEKLENTYAYSFASRQYARFTEHGNQPVKIERQSGNEKVTIRFAGIEIQRDARKEGYRENNLLERAERLYRKITEK